MPSKFRGKIISNLEFYDLTTLTKLRIKTEGHRYFQTQKFSKTVSSISFSGRSRRLCSTQMRKGSQKDSGGDPRKRMQRRGGDKVAVWLALRGPTGDSKSLQQLLLEAGEQTHRWRGSLTTACWPHLQRFSSVRLGWGPGLSISNRLPGAVVGAAGLVQLRVAVVQRATNSDWSRWEVFWRGVLQEDKIDQILNVFKRLEKNV